MLLSSNERGVKVALLMEGVDRNYANDNDTLTTWVALLMEGVDRNGCTPAASAASGVSPSSWRAWIEIKNW